MHGHLLQQVPPAQNQTRLRTAEQFVAAEGGHRGAGEDALLHGGLGAQAVSAQVHQGAAAEVVHHGKAAAGAEFGQLGHRRLGGEAHQAEVAAMHAEQHRRLRRDGLLVVAQPHLVRRADLDDPGAALLDDVRHAEGAADLHLLPAGDDDLPPPGQRRQGEEDGGGAVVDGEGGLGAGKFSGEGGDVLLPIAALAGLRIDFQQAVAAGSLEGGGAGRFGQHGAPQSRVQNDPRRVDGPPQGASLALRQDGRRRPQHLGVPTVAGAIGRDFPGAQAGAQVAKRLPQSRRRPLAPVRLCKATRLTGLQEAVHLREGTQDCGRG